MFAEDLTSMFDETYGFAVPAVYKTMAISVLYDEEYYAANGQEVDIEGTKPAAICRSVDVLGVKIGDSITVDLAPYTVINVKPDGTGITVLALEDALVMSEHRYEIVWRLRSQVSRRPARGHSSRASTRWIRLLCPASACM